MTITNSTSTSTADKKRMLFPPEETIWKRYSEHHEAPLSGITSFALHALAIGFAFLIVQYVRSNLNDTNPPKVEVGKIVYGQGSGGTPDNHIGTPGEVGQENDGPIGGNTPQEIGTNKHDTKGIPETRQKLTPTQQKNIRQIVSDQTDFGRRLIDNPTPMLGTLAKMKKGLRKALGNSRNPKGGPGGIGDSPNKGPGNGIMLNEKEKRVLRWSITFSTKNGSDYARQLNGLGAILAIPTQDDSYRVIRDLTQRPAQAKQEDVSKIQRIYWIDDRPRSVRSLSTALGLKPEPELFVAFFPEQLEKKMLNLEMEAARKKFGRTVTEDEIHQTQFAVISKSESTFDVKVLRVRRR